MLNKKVEAALNAQINAEWYSGYLYQSMAAWFEAQGMKGFANWMNIQCLEELSHGMKMYNFVNETGGTVTLTAIEGPKTEWKSPLDVFEEVYAHEQKVTGLINDLVNLAIEEKDHASRGMLQYFIDEQVEEEASADEVRQQLKLAGDAPGAIFMLDREMGARVFTGGALKPAAE